MAKNQSPNEALKQLLGKNAQNLAHEKMIQTIKDQLLMCLVLREGGLSEFPLDEVDQTGNMQMTMAAKDGVFKLEVKPKCP